jgi:hypothetical protein
MTFLKESSLSDDPVLLTYNNTTTQFPCKY